VAGGIGTVHLDLVSLFPQATFHDRPGGLRADLAQVGLLGAEAEPAPDFADWAAESGNWEPEVDGRIQQTAYGADDARLVFAEAAAGPSYAFSVRARKNGGGEGFAETSPGNRYQWSVGGWLNRGMRLQRVDDGVVHDLNDAVAGPVETGRWYELRVEVDGRRIRCFRDGELVHDLEDAPAVPEVFAVSAVRDSSAGDVIVKIANSTSEPVAVRLRLAGADVGTGLVRTSLAAPPHATSRFGPAPASPAEDRLTGPVCDIPPYSFTVLRSRPGTRPEEDQE
jgi:hypothetical protein